MISTELSNHADRILGWAANGVQPSTAAMCQLARCLLDLSRQARQLERLPVDVEALHDVD